MAGTTGAQMETADEGGMARRSDGINGVRVGDRLVGGEGTPHPFSGKVVLAWAAVDKVARIVIVELDDAEGVESRKGKAKKKSVLVLTEKDDDKVRRHSDRKNQQPAARLLQIPNQYQHRSYLENQEFIEYERQLKIEATTRHAASRAGRDLPPFSIPRRPLLPDGGGPYPGSGHLVLRPGRSSVRRSLLE